MTHLTKKQAAKWARSQSADNSGENYPFRVDRSERNTGSTRTPQANCLAPSKLPGPHAANVCELPRHRLGLGVRGHAVFVSSGVPKAWSSRCLAGRLDGTARIFQDKGSQRVQSHDDCVPWRPRHGKAHVGGELNSRTTMARSVTLPRCVSAVRIAPNTKHRTRIHHHRIPFVI